MGDFSNLFSTLGNLPGAIDEANKKGLKKSAAIVAGKAKSNLGTYQPSKGPYPAWSKLKPEAVRRKHLNVKGKVTRSGRRYLRAHGTWGSGGSDDSPLVDKGHLKQSITTDDSQLDSNKVMFVGVAGGRGNEGGGGPSKYAAAHEFGYAPKKIPARPYLRPALHESKEEIKEEVKKALFEQLRGSFR